MNTYWRTSFWLSMISHGTSYWALLRTVYGSLYHLTGSTHTLSKTQKLACKSLLEALQPMLWRACRDNVATLYFDPSALVTLHFFRWGERPVLTSPSIWRRMLRLPTLQMRERKGVFSRREISRLKLVRLFTLDPVRASDFVGSIAIQHRIPGTNTYVLKLSAKAILLKRSARNCNPLR